MNNIKVIDFHTHIFPNRVAPLALRNLSMAGNAFPLFDGTMSGLVLNMEENHIDISVCMPIVTNARHTKSINDFVLKVNATHDNLISFGSLHPDYENNIEEIKRLKENGILGIKFHPVYQNCPVDSEKFIKLINLVVDNGMYALFHAGDDPGYPDNDYSSIDRIINMLNQVHDETRIILAHLGGLFRFEEAYEMIAGRNVYLDTAMCFDKCYYKDGSTKDLIDEELFYKFIERHGSKKILFGTDNPWTKADKMVEYVNNLKISKEDKENILYKNACRILNIEY